MAQRFKRKVYLTFPTDTVKDAIICDMYDKYKVRFNIRSASVNDSVGLIALELEGEDDKIGEAIEYFRSRGLTVEPIEMNVIAG
ncbi:MAG: FeS-binding protein [Deltaproteobacteria bacterium]|nr:FeS-binding protein [Deltaproteobacteria bacterium]